MNKTLTAIKGVKVGHSTHLDKLTGTTVVLFDRDFPMAYKSYGGDPGTFNTDTLKNGRSDYRGHAMFISGGSWSGLRAGAEIMTVLTERKIGFKSNKIINPNVTGAIVYDLGTRIEQFNPAFGREAVENATSDPVERGNVGAGTGTSVGKFQYQNYGKSFAGMKAGIGCSRIDLGNGVVVSALTVLNAIGNIILPNGEILAGNRSAVDGEKYKSFEDFSEFLTQEKANTTISIVGLNVDLKTRENYERVAQIATHGQVRAIDPVNTSLDGDTVFVFSNEEVKDFLTPLGEQIARDSWANLQIDIISQAAAKAVQESIYDACRQADTIPLEGAYEGIVPSAKDYSN
ncbi:MAG TPA: P1 family peptidase [Candidatus Sulfotelmatobacter sp.]|nr:P1 family peptidase [Candidatus Sulfotelmatobacter sp.]